MQDRVQDRVQESVEMTGGGMSGGERARWAPLRAFRTPLRGHVFAAPPVEGTELAADVPVRLRREPTNPKDPLAVAVWTEAGEGAPWRLGYLDRAVAARIAPRLDGGLELEGRLEGWVAEPRGRWLRPLLRVEPSASGSKGGRGSDDRPMPDAAAAALADLGARPPGVRRRVLGRARRPGRRASG